WIGFTATSASEKMGPISLSPAAVIFSVKQKCAICGTACKHLALSDNLKPQEKMFFKSPVETALQYFSHISQVWSFQKKQTDLLIAFYKHRITKLETAMQEAQQALVSQDKELSVLRKENGELKKFLAILKLPHDPVSSIAVKWSAESIPYREAGFGSLGQAAKQVLLIVFNRLEKGFSALDSLPTTEADGITQWERSMDHFQIDHLQGKIVGLGIHWNHQSNQNPLLLLSNPPGEVEPMSGLSIVH
ncbi:hypothetical protein H8959_016838, partial [Pygathrix nigripes]